MRTTISPTFWERWKRSAIWIACGAASRAGSRICTTTVPADHFDSRMKLEPGGNRCFLTIREQVYQAMAFQIQQDSAVLHPFTKSKIVYAKDGRRVDRSGTSVARTNRRRVSELTGIPSTLAKHAPAFPALHETNGLQLRCAALCPSSICAFPAHRTVRQMCVGSRLCWSRQNGAPAVLAAPAYRPSTSLRWYACNNCEPAVKRSDKQDKKPAGSCYSLQVRVAGEASDEDGSIASQCQGAIKNPH